VGESFELGLGLGVNIVVNLAQGTKKKNFKKVL
jgi:hypothetical protein